MAYDEDTEVTIQGTLIHETNMAYKVDFGMSEEVWLPKSCTEIDGDSFTFPENIAIEKGLENLA